MIVGIENRDGNTNVRFNQKETLERIFKRLEASEIYISRARMDCGSCSEEIVDMVEAHCRHFYIRANRCSSFYDSMFALTGWKTVEINGIEFELNLKSATKLFSVLLASKRPLITELADKLRLKYPLLPTISPCPTMRLEAIRSIIPISCRRYPKSV